MDIVKAVLRSHGYWREGKAHIDSVTGKAVGVEGGQSVGRTVKAPLINMEKEYIVHFTCDKIGVAVQASSAEEAASKAKCKAYSMFEYPNTCGFTGPRVLAVDGEPYKDDGITLARVV